MVKWDAMAGRERHLLPCKSESVVSCSGCCDKTRSRGSRLQVMCFHKAAWERKCTYMVWSLFIASSFLLDDCRLSPPPVSSALLLESMILSAVCQQNKSGCDCVRFSQSPAEVDAENTTTPKLVIWERLTSKWLSGLDIVRWTWQFVQHKRIVCFNRAGNQGTIRQL